MSFVNVAYLASSDMVDVIWESVGMEVVLFALFSIGFMLFRSKTLQQFLAPAKGKKIMDKDVEISEPDALCIKQIETSFASGRFQDVVDSWPAVQHMTQDTMKTVVRSLMELKRHAQLKEVLCKILDEHTSLRTASMMNVVLSMVPADNFALLTHAYEAFSEMGVSSNDATFENIAGALKDASPERIAEVCTQMKIRMTARNYSVLIKSALKAKKIDQAMKLVGAMRDAGHVVPPSCVASVLRAAADVPGAVKQAMNTMPGAMTTSPEALASILEFAQKSHDLELLDETYGKAVDKKIPLTYASYDALVKAYASHGDSRATKLFDEMIKKCYDPSEGSLVSIVALSADSKHIQMAERVMEYAQQKGRCSLALYSSLMKVYSTSRLFDKTCDLYDSMLKDGIEPDTVAYGSLIKAAVEGGRLELARKLFGKSGNPDLLNYMSLIRAAGREKNPTKALALLKELEESPIEVDTTAYNCVLDVCVACADRMSASILFERMKAKDRVDVVSYNTRLKGLTASGAWSQVETTLEEMRAQNVKANVVTYNSLINAAIGKGDLSSAWRFLEDMEVRGVAMDAYTLSIMMKGLKYSQRKDDMDRILALMDRAKVVPDEVLMNTMLDACVRLRDPQRLARALDQFKASGVVPSMHAYAVLIKAYGHAHRIDQAKRVWTELTVERNTTPNEEVYGCMIDACVFNDDLASAMKLFFEMKKKVSEYSKCASIFFSLIRGFIWNRDMEKALDVFKQMKEMKCSADARIYQTLINGCVKFGNLEEAVELLDDALRLDGESKASRVWLESETIENVLLTIGRRQKSNELGAPLMERLRKARIEVSDRASSAVSRMSAQNVGSSARFHSRRHNAK